jgi:hypothetical protein
MDKVVVFGEHHIQLEKTGVPQHGCGIRASPL